MSEKITKTSKNAFVWNIIGSSINAASTLILTIIATRIAGVEQGGILGLAFGLCQIFAEIASYEIRPYQSTDMDERFKFSHYLGLRVLTCLIMVIICAFYVFGYKYSGSKASVIFAICMFKMLDSFSDVFQGLFQQKEHLEYAGKELSLRITASIIFYILTLIITRNPVYAAWSTVVISAFIIILYDIPVAKKFTEKITAKFSFSVFKAILIECLPLFVSAFMNMYILNASKIQIDRIVPDLQGYWTPVYMPAAIINLFSIFAFRPMLTSMRISWSSNNNKRFLKIMFTLIIWILIITVLAVLGGALLGIPVLQLLYGIELAPFKSVLILVLIGGGFNALSTFLYYAITVMRRQYYLIIDDGITFISTIILTPVLVSKLRITGAALAYLLCMIIRTLCFALTSIYGYKVRKEN